ncbi:MAG: UvrD-helicase domain-containing protein [Devosiaceae bacterium]|nr:UvrD-helicase domain-containing protein [Devosiaceae bacterium MH13]
MSDPAPLPARKSGGIAARALAAAGAGAPWLEGLNPEQLRAVETLDGPVLVLAGAGTGKTRVLTTRIAHILGTGRAAPGQIMAVTFTNKAAREMKQRIGSMIGAAVEGMPWLGTFHALGTRILRYHAELAGLKSSFTILDTDDQIRLLKQLLQAENIDEKRWPARQLASHIDRWKNRGLSPEQVPAADGSFANGRGIDLYAAYQERLAVLNAVDFGDLLTKPIKLFQDNPDILAEYHRRFRYILVDEYQDTNVAQYLWLRLLAQGTGDDKPNVCCVGDDDQSIYGWRGAEVDNILRFERDFPGATVIRLERNYRSTSPILAAASHLIAHNEDRLGKTLFTDVTPDDGESEEKVTVASAWDSSEEARAVCEEIEQLQRKGHPLNEMAILVRTSAQMREFEDRFFTLGLSYRVVGGPRFYERQEIRDALAYLRVIAQPEDGLAFERIVNVPKRGLGDTTVRKINALSRGENMSPLAAARLMSETEELRPQARTALRNLIADFDRWRGALETLPHTELAEIVLDESGYTRMWQEDTSPQAPGRLENLKELIRSMEEFENLAGFLEHIALVADVENQENEDAVTLMTLHAAKGLEFDTVFLPGWEEGLFPSQRSLDENGRAGLEEERRLAYVGLTRARRRAKLWFSSNRRIHGLWQSSIPSRFLDELPEAHVDVIEQTSSYGGYGARGYGNYGASRFDRPVEMESAYKTPGWQRAQAARGTGRRPSSGPITIDGDLVARSVTETSSSYAIGDRVFHQKFGYGHIATIEGNKLTIDFDKAGRKKVVDSFVSPHSQAG